MYCPASMKSPNIPLVNTKLKGKNLVKYFGAVIWNAILINVKKDTSLNGFKDSGFQNKRFI